MNLKTYTFFQFFGRQKHNPPIPNSSHSEGSKHGNYTGLATLLQIDQATLYADNELTNTQLTVYLLAEQN